MEKLLQLYKILLDTYTEQIKGLEKRKMENTFRQIFSGLEMVVFLTDRSTAGNKGLAKVAVLCSANSVVIAEKFI